jgi:hypothetical protein
VEEPLTAKTRPKISSPPSGQVFTLDISGRPTLVLEAADIEFARGICSLSEFRMDLTNVTSNGLSICPPNALLVVRGATQTEVVAFKRAVSLAPPSDEFNFAFLIKVDRVNLVSFGSTQDTNDSK